MFCMLFSTFNNQRLKNLTWQQFEVEYAFILGRIDSPIYYFGAPPFGYYAPHDITITIATLTPLTDCRLETPQVTIVPNNEGQWQIQLWDGTAEQGGPAKAIAKDTDFWTFTSTSTCPMILDIELFTTTTSTSQADIYPNMPVNYQELIYVGQDDWWFSFRQIPY
jgi:hypothetical protein